LLFPSFPNSHHLNANFPNYKGPRPQIQMSRKITVYRVIYICIPPFTSTVNQTFLLWFLTYLLNIECWWISWTCD
jgi:hypothetical protein